MEMDRSGDSPSQIRAITLIDFRIPASQYPSSMGSAGALRRELGIMKKLLGCMAVLLAVTFSPRAHADTFTDYTINFLGPVGTLLPTSGTIVYDSTPGALNPFSTFTVNWDGETFDFAAVANQYNYLAGSQTPALFNTSLPGCTGATGLQSLIVAMVACAPDAIWAAQADTAANSASFTIAFPGVTGGIPSFVDLECCTIPPPTVTARPGYANGGGGLPLTITDPPRTIVPEPGTGALLCAGIAMVLVLGKRKARRPVLTA